MKALSRIKFGFSDAENYKRREEKMLFSKIFLRTEALDELCNPATFFLVGEKGTGKTAYAVHLSTSPYKQIHSAHRFIRETDYQKFIQLKRSSNLTISDYTDIWKVIIYLLIADALSQRDKNIGELIQFPKFKALRAAIDEYYSNAFSPEIQTAMKFVEDSTRAAELLAKHAGLGGKYSETERTSSEANTARFQLNLLAIERSFREALGSLKLDMSQLLFIDGVDIRPSSIPYVEYLDCVKGLANAVWGVNNDVFPEFRDSKGRLRVVMLVRPDIFNSLGLQNRNTKLKDNSAVLSWLTNYRTYRSSELFAMADRMFSAQQDEPLRVGEAWDHYFPFDAKSVDSEQDDYSSFILFLRYSFYRPRDILTALDILREINSGKIADGATHFAYDDVLSPEFRRAYGTYALGEIRDALSFYYDDEEYELFLKFFEYLNGERKFSYASYLQAFQGFSRFLEMQERSRPSFMKSADEFLQFLYDQSVLCFIETATDERFIRWCFRERTISNPSPKVKAEQEYEIHYALGGNTLNTGKALSGRGANAEADGYTNFGRVLKINQAKRFGFIQQEGLPIDIFFRHPGDGSLRQGQAVRYVLIKDRQGRLEATNVRSYKK